MHIGQQRWLQLPSLAGVRQILDEFRSGGKESLETILDGAIADGVGEMGLPSAGLPVQNQGPPLGHKVRSIHASFLRSPFRDRKHSCRRASTMSTIVHRGSPTGWPA